MPLQSKILFTNVWNTSHGLLNAIVFGEANEEHPQKREYMENYEQYRFETEKKLKELKPLWSTFCTKIVQETHDKSISDRWCKPVDASLQLIQRNLNNQNFPNGLYPITERLFQSYQSLDQYITKKYNQPLIPSESGADP